MTDVLDPIDPDAPVIDPLSGVDTDGVIHTEVEHEQNGLRTSRGVLAVSLSTLGAGAVVGGIFQGAGGRVVACVAGLLGVLVGVGASRLRGTIASQLALVVGIAATGVLMVAVTSGSDVLHTAKLVQDAAHQGTLLRPPVPFIAGWHAIVGWLMAVVGAVAVWTALEVKRPTVAVLLPLPLAAVAAISIPTYAQVASGIAILVLFAGALGVVATGQLVGNDEGGQAPSLGFQVRRILRSLLVIGVISGILVAAASQGFLFPKPVYNPAQQAQKPHVVPPTNAPNRPLFTVRSRSLGPYRTGDLDVYQNGEWLTAPFNASPIINIPSSGVIIPGVTGGASASITIAGLTGQVLPSLSNTVGIIANGPQLAYQARGDQLSIPAGNLTKGFTYTLSASALPQISQLEADTTPIPSEEEQFTKAPPLPASLEQLLVSLKKANNWDTFIAIRAYVLKTVTADGAGVPAATPPSRIADVLTGTKKGTPFEITSALALLSRWAGIPARIGYGFQADPNQRQNGDFVITPADAISYPEVFFPGYGWLAVTGSPEHAASNSKNQATKASSSTTPSSQFTAPLFVPLLTKPATHNLRTAVLIGAGILAAALVGYLVYLLLPALQKRLRRSKRRDQARQAGPRLRLALAYAEWRDDITDLGYRHDTDTPLAFLRHFSNDDEHAELAWLVTRGLWGDLRDDVTPEMASHAEELSRALRRRLSSSHPATLRFIAALSRAVAQAPLRPGPAGPAQRTSRGGQP